MELLLLRSTCASACMCMCMSMSGLLDATISPYRPLGLAQVQAGSLWRLGGAPPDYWLAVTPSSRVPESWSVLVRGKEAVELL